MDKLKSIAGKVRYAVKRAKGLDIEDDAAPYRELAREARASGADALSDTGILAEARALAARARARAEGTLDDRDAARCLGLAAEAAKRRLGLDPFEEQIAAAAAMLRGKIAQMGTGEGKTLAAALAASCRAMGGRGFHVLTANDYLARRDAEWMRPIYEALGLSVASIDEKSGREERRAAYLADVCYLSARELGFDFLRDGLARESSDLVQRAFNGALVDEADFIMIDEARVPLVIAGAVEGDGVDVREIDRIARELDGGADYRVDPEGRNVAVTASGYARAASMLGRDGEELPDAAKARLFAALHARCLLRRDVDYVVKEGRTRLVDSFTGRVAERRQWPWGIQAALEAKEGLDIGPEGRIFGSVTVQHLLGLYPFLAAMTATAESAAEEFGDVYELGVAIIPPAKSSRRIDEPDAVFWTRAARAAAVVAEIARARRSGRPVLVGTASIHDSEELAWELARAGIASVVLNAKNDEEEAALIARAGELGAVTISTDMAGRGTDIRLGEDPCIREEGGLYVIGTCLHESRRLDDQLRGRAGRQGDPGTTRFFLSLEDEIFARFGVRGFLPEPFRSGSPAPDGAAVGRAGEISDPACRREIRRAQAIIEGQNSTIRRLLIKRSLIVEYDRRYVRELRDAALVRGELPPAVEEELARMIEPEPEGPAEPAAAREPIGRAARSAMTGAFIDRLDAAWADHLGMIEDLREGIGLRAYGGRDPSREYLSAASAEFERAMRELEADTIEDCREILGSAPAMPAAPAMPLAAPSAPPAPKPEPRDELESATDAEPQAASERRAVPPRPASTWTYAVDEEKVPGMDLGAMTNLGAILLGPLALPIFLLGKLVSAVAKALARRKEGPSKP